MTIETKGTITYQNFGVGAWALTTEEITYELFEPSEDLQQEGLSVKVIGQVRDDIMTLAMIGPVLDVQSFECLNPS